MLVILWPEMVYASTHFQKTLWLTLAKPTSHDCWGIKWRDDPYIPWAFWRNTRIKINRQANEVSFHNILYIRMGTKNGHNPPPQKKVVQFGVQPAPNWPKRAPVKPTQSIEFDSPILLIMARGEQEKVDGDCPRRVFPSTLLGLGERGIMSSKELNGWQHLTC